MASAIHIVSRDEFLEQIYENTDRFMASIAAHDVYVVKGFYPRDEVLAFREMLVEFSEAEEPSWHPCLDGVPDYHRINDEYEGSWVKAKMHAFYFHRFNGRVDLFERFRDIFEIKNHLAGEAPDAYLDTIPSDGIISRLVAQQYPRGGGYLAEHIDPASRFARLQTIVQASTIGEDFQTGGLYLRESPDSEQIWVDPHTEMGDLMVLTPEAPHGVAPVDPEAECDWSVRDGRWMILPIILRSDYNMDPATKPRAVA
ncbi:MAG TPA: hypothetical protein VNZ62_13250 [Capillimicrobium sp.]|nr:hypothetical protein [Capillimicrobium sp.]